MRAVLPFLFEHDERSKGGCVHENALRDTVEVELPEIGLENERPAVGWMRAHRTLALHNVRGSLAAPFKSIDDMPIRASAFQEMIDQSLRFAHQGLFHFSPRNFPVPPYMRRARWNPAMTPLNFVAPSPPLRRRAVVEDLHERRRLQAKAFYERTFSIIDGEVWAAAQEPVLSLRLWAKRVGVELSWTRTGPSAHRKFSLRRIVAMTEFVNGPLGRACGALPWFDVLDETPLRRCDLLELAWDTMGLCALPDLDHERLLDGPPEAGSEDARSLVLVARKRLVDTLAAQAAGRLKPNPLIAKFQERWDFELALPYAEQLLAPPEIDWGPDDTPQDVLDDLATLSP